MHVHACMRSCVRVCKCICSQMYICRVFLISWLAGVARACVAGASWTLVTANATWDARSGHTSVIDLAGYIYVLGCVVDIGHEEVYNYNDVWRADQGAVWHRCATHAA
jgi:hypothetical protein